MWRLPLPTLVLAALIACASAPVEAQSAAPAAPAAPVRGLRSPLTCRQVPADSIPPELSFGFVFSDGRPMHDDRDVRVLYDADGRPRSLVLLQTDPPADSAVSISHIAAAPANDVDGWTAAAVILLPLIAHAIAGRRGFASGGPRTSVTALGEERT